MVGRSKLYSQGQSIQMYDSWIFNYIFLSIECHVKTVRGNAEQVQARDSQRPPDMGWKTDENSRDDFRRRQVRIHSCWCSHFKQVRNHRKLRRQSESLLCQWDTCSCHIGPQAFKWTRKGTNPVCWWFSHDSENLQISNHVQGSERPWVQE